MPEKHLLILGIRGVPAQHGGFESFAAQLVPWMVRAGWRVTVYCQGSDTGERYEDTWEGCRRVHIPVRGENAIATIEFDIKSMREAVRENGVMLTLGYNTGFLSTYARMRGCLNLINMDGIEWKRAKYSKAQQAYLWLNERLAAAAGDILIADHPEIAKHHAEHAPAQKIRMIPYGSEKVERADETLLEAYGVTVDRFLTVIARPEPENSLLEIVRAFSRKRRGVKLVVLGKYSRESSYQASVLTAASDEVVFPGAVYDREHVHALRRYSLAYVHGHQVGGTNPSLVEALGAGNAVLAHDNPFNRWVAGEAACYFADEDTYEYHLQNLIASASLRQKMREAAYYRWLDVFTWPTVLKAYETAIEDAFLERCNSPSK